MKATTRTSAPGSKPRRAAAGFTLLELMVVVLIVAVATGMTALSLRDRSQSKLEEEGARLSALLETARTQSRIIGTDVRWQPLAQGGFQFLGLPSLAAGSRAASSVIYGYLWTVVFDRVPSPLGMNITPMTSDVFVQ